MGHEQPLGPWSTGTCHFLCVLPGEACGPGRPSSHHCDPWDVMRAMNTHGWSCFSVMKKASPSPAPPDWKEFPQRLWRALTPSTEHWKRLPEHSLLSQNGRPLTLAASLCALIRVSVWCVCEHVSESAVLFRHVCGRQAVFQTPLFQGSGTHCCPLVAYYECILQCPDPKNRHACAQARPPAFISLKL